MSDRIRLAEAMGWTHIRMKWVAMEEKSYPFGCVPRNVNDKHLKEQIPDPYTNANDDYAVLEWMRDDSRCMEFPRYVGALSDVMDKRLAASHAANYQIGDYARAALKVLEDKG